MDLIIIFEFDDNILINITNISSIFMIKELKVTIFFNVLKQ